MMAPYFITDGKFNFKKEVIRRTSFILYSPSIVVEKETNLPRNPNEESKIDAKS